MQQYIKFRNTGTKRTDEKGKPTVAKDTVRFHVKMAQGIEHFEVPFGNEVDIPEELTRPRRGANGARLLSPVEQLAPQLEPVDEEWKAQWMLPPAEERPGRPTAKAFTVEELVRSGIPAGVAETLVAAANAARAEALRAAQQDNG